VVSHSLAAAGLAAALLSPAAAAAGPFRDLNHNGRLDAYEDSRLSDEKRAGDLLRRMTLEEKIGTMMHGSLPGNEGRGSWSSKGYDLATVRQLLAERHITSFITRLTVPPAEFARQNNAVQRIAENSRLGIPVTISTDPRNHFQAIAGASTTGGGFSLWPEPLGFAAVGDTALVEQFAAIARREYRAVGIQMALSPQADLATEPRWPRGTATFGSDPASVSALAGAYVRGFQGSNNGLSRGGVATVTKHWVGYGAQPSGFDAHNAYGRSVRLDDANFARHVRAFDGALAAGTAGIMPTYAIIEGVRLGRKPLPRVGAGFSRELLTRLLRGRHDFRGVILSDWGITNDCPAACASPTTERPQTRDSIGMPWGVESLSKPDRFALGVNAGLDQFGGVDDPSPLLEAVRHGKVTAQRIDSSVRRILLQKFALGLFDDPYVDPAEADRVLGSAAAKAAADSAQRRAQVLLANDRGMLPLPRSTKVWLHNLDRSAAEAAGLTVVPTLEQADIAIVRTSTPFETLHPNHFFGAQHHEGRLDFRDGEPGYEAIKRASAAVPTIVVIDMDRPAILTNIRDKARAILVTFGASDAAVLDTLTGRSTAQGHLPFELPSSMAEVERQDPAAPDDTAHPLFPRGAGLVLAGSQ
jgi:beta-glucosidase